MMLANLKKNYPPSDMKWIFDVAAFYLYPPPLFLLDKLQLMWYYYINNNYRAVVANLLRKEYHYDY